VDADIFTPEELAGIAAAAATIDERLAGDHVASVPLDESERREAHERLVAWRRAVGSTQAFAARLSFAGIDEDRATALLGRVRLDRSRPLPRWVAAFARTARAMRVPSSTGPDAEAKNDGLLPFEDLLRPAVAAAWRDLRSRVGGGPLDRLAPAAVSALQLSLLRRLSRASAPALYADFSLFRHLSRLRAGGLSWPIATSGGQHLYHAFVAAWRTGRDREFFLANPVAARIIGTAALAWLESAAELVDHLDRDVTALAETFAGGRALGPVTGLETDLSDPHRGGRRVVILEFAELKIVYKPKDLGIDLAWRDLTRWLAVHGAPFVANAPDCLARDGYGWCGHVTESAAFREASPADHRRAGGLLAILHWLRGTDFHDENVIAGAYGPAPVDLETLLRPALAPGIAEPFGDPATAAAAGIIAKSVLATHCLRPATPSAGMDPAAHAGFRHVNTDAMTRESTWANTVPRPNADAASLAEHRDDFIAGFVETYRFLLHHRAALTAPGGPLARFRDVRLRVLLRDTTAYELLAQRASEHGRLRNGVDWSLPFELLARADAGCAGPERERFRAAERRALAHLDIPLFTAQADAAFIETCGGERIAAGLAGTPVDQLMAHVAALGPDDLRFQERVLRCVLPRLPQPAGLPANPHAGQVRDFVAEAIRLGDMLAAAAIRVGDSAAFIGFTPLDDAYGEIRATGLDLYSGTTGIAVFLSALAKFTGESRFVALATAALGPVRAIEQAADGGAATARRAGIGGAEGIASVVYGLVRIGGLMDDPEPVALAGRLARFIDADLIDSDHAYDVMNGAAGAVLGLLALHQADESSALARAVACGEHLLRGCRKDARGNTGWRTFSDAAAFLTGFSHGAAGIALALLRLHRATGDARFRNAASDALRYERRVFLPARGNWPDFRFTTDEAAEQPCQWCHGATGVGLARLACLGLGEDDAVVAAEIDAALKTTLAAPPSPVDHLCCGNFGRLDLLLSVGRLRDRADLIDAARERARQYVERAAIAGGYGGLGGDDALHPGLFLGIAGIGYELLRLAEPHALPSLLSWDCDDAVAE
jgi:type 2 lantibiotic biosynthesis protein LanM